MPLAPVDTVGTQLFYEDSGAPPHSTTYATIVVIHGAYFNGGVFKPTFPFAAQQNLRLVLLNQRDYAMSTPYNEVELKQLTSGDKDRQEDFIHSRVEELGRFLEWYIEKEAIPLLVEVDGGRTGGLSLMGWSSGNHLSLSFFARGDIMPGKTRAMLDRYLRSLVIYDTCHQPFGISKPTEEVGWKSIEFNPNNDIVELFPKLVWSDYSHSPVVLDSLLPGCTTASIPSVHDFSLGLGVVPNSLDLPPPPTPETLSQIANKDGLLRSQFPILSISQEIYAENSKHFLTDVERKKTLWPKVTVGMLVCGKSLRECVYPMWELNKLRVSGGLTREAKYRYVEQFNHMAQWYYPERFTSIVAELV